MTCSRAVVELRIRNMVARGGLGRRTDPTTLAKKLPNAKFEHRKATTVQYRLSEFEVTALVTSTGTIILTGAKGHAALAAAYARVLDDCRTAGFESENPEALSVKNIVATWDFGAEVALDWLIGALLTDERFSQASYEPEIFPGVIARTGSASILVFRSGKCVCTGGSTLEDYSKPIEWVAELIPLLAPSPRPRNAKSRSAFGL